MSAQLRSYLVLFVASALADLAAAVLAGEPSLVKPSPQKHLLLDGRVVAAVDGLQLMPGPVAKDPHNPVITADKPWENALNNLYPNVTFDADVGLFKLWYKCVLAEKPVIAKMMPPTTIHDVGWYLLYATSKDGLAWNKPELGIVGFDGSTKTNIVAQDVANAGVFKDPHDPDAARRYKVIYDVGFNLFRVRFSPDGIHWSQPVEPKGLTLPGAQVKTGDTHSNAFWDERLGKYVLITRIYRGQRLVARSQSSDFLEWEVPKVVLQSTEQEGQVHQTYCMAAFPYANGYLGYVMMYHAKTDRTVDCELAWSNDSVRWQRVCPGRPLIPRGDEGSYDSKCIYAPAGPAIAQDGKLLIYYGGSSTPHVGWKRHCLPCLARLRVDGFAGYEPIQSGGRGTLLTQPMRVTAESLRVTADAQGGSLRVAVVDADGYPLDDCQPITTDATESPIVWKGGKDLAALKGKAIRLKFSLDRAKLYALSGVDPVEATASKDGSLQSK